MQPTVALLLTTVQPLLYYISSLHHRNIERHWLLLSIWTLSERRSYATWEYEQYEYKRIYAENDNWLADALDMSKSSLNFSHKSGCGCCRVDKYYICGETCKIHWTQSTQSSHKALNCTQPHRTSKKHLVGLKFWTWWAELNILKFICVLHKSSKWSLSTIGFSAGNVIEYGCELKWAQCNLCGTFSKKLLMQFRTDECGTDNSKNIVKN